MSQKTIVTHISPDLDAVCAVWLIKKFMPEWTHATVNFVPAGKTLSDLPPDDNPNIIHVDTGLGQFDHHQTNENTCAGKKVFEYLVNKRFIKKSLKEPLKRIVSVVNKYDHFDEVNMDDAQADMHDFSIHYILRSLKGIGFQDRDVVDNAIVLLDSLLIHFKSKVSAEREIQDGLVFKSAWGRSLAVETGNQTLMKVGFKKGLELIVTKSGSTGLIRVKTHPQVKKSLSSLYKLFQKSDPEATWFYHPSGHMLLNGTQKNPDTIPSKMTLIKAVTVIKSVK